MCGGGIRGRTLPRSFYARDSLELAPDLLNKVLVHDDPSAGRLAVRLVEVEAYLGGRDPASHAYRGLTPRTAPMFGPPGRSYVYFVYGMYHCLNVVTEREGIAGAVLLRGAEPVAGFDDLAPRALAGPGKLARSFGLTTAHTNLDLVEMDLSARLGTPVEILSSQTVQSVKGEPLLRVKYRQQTVGGR